VLAFVLASLVDRALRTRGERLAAAVTRGDISPGVDTRLRFLRRAIYFTIVVIGLAIALSQFASINKLAASVLASGVLAAAIIGFAARQTLANVVAGVMLAITQPLRIGDHVVFEGDAGVVEDVRLTYTYLRGGDGQRIIIPNERLAAGTLRNDTIVDARVTAQASVWIGPDADTERALAVLGEEPDVDVSVAEVAHDGVRLLVSDHVGTAGDRAQREAALRAGGLRRLRAAGLLPGQGPASGGRNQTDS
jgi:small-conductance mechanosensitive channel